MSNIARYRPTSALTRNDPARLRLFVKSVGKGLIGHEIDEAVEWCEVYGANPFTKDIYFFIFDAGDPAKRRVVPVLGIGLYRKIAARSGDYRPDEEPPRFRYDETLKGPANPRGIVDCEITVNRFSHGAWHPFTSRVRWDERAPIIQDGSEGMRWEPVVPARNHPPGHKMAGKPVCRKVPVGIVTLKLDPNKPNWLTMGETMIAKCTEADALRRGWPEGLAGSYADGELDRHETIEGTATEIIDRAETDDKQRLLGGKDAVTIDWCAGGPLERVPDGQFFERMEKWMLAKDRSSTEIKVFVSRNKPGLADFWARNGNDALELKKRREQRIADLEDQERKAEQR